MDPGAPDITAETDKCKVRSFINDIIDSPALSKDDGDALVNSNLRIRPRSERNKLIGILKDEIPKLKAIEQQVATKRTRAEQRFNNKNKNIQYLDDTWGSRQNWAPSQYVGDAGISSENTITPIASLTRLAVRKGIPLASFWQPGRELHTAATSHPMGILSRLIGK